MIRGTYGPDAIYVEMVARALELWRDYEKMWGQQLFHQTGALWMAGSNDTYEKASLPLLKGAGLEAEELTKKEVSRRFPQIDFHDVEWAIYEPNAGYLLARRGCQTVLAGFRAEGGDYRQLAAEPISSGGKVDGLRLSDGSRLEADQYVFACGPWLSKIFPELRKSLVHPTRQEIFYFGPLGGDDRYHETRFPVWIDNGQQLFYGIPGNEWRGFKIADDTRGEAFDPTTGDRRPSQAGIAAARGYLEQRFPGMKGAPLLEARVCQYENSPDGHFIVDRHPDQENVWIVGGGSGHGYKHGPALGERLAQQVLGERKRDPFFSISRF